MTNDDALIAALDRLGLLKSPERPTLVPLGGGVSSDIWKVETAAGTFCAKRALARLKVSADWRAPIERNAYEAAWMQEAAAIVPDAVPRLIGQDPEAGLLVMAYLPPDDFPLWKNQLGSGLADTGAAARVGDRLVRIHAATARKPELRDRFPTDRIFYDIRLEPYLVATAKAQPATADALHQLVEITGRSKKSLVHGDVSPKNILIGKAGPVFLDAECAWFGDPAFDLAFCLNHLFLKCVWVRDAAHGFLQCFDALAGRYLESIDWEPRADLEARAAALLPGLMLGRIDGKSPVEYLTAERDKDLVRSFAIDNLKTPPKTLSELRARWTERVDDNLMTLGTEGGGR